jgi:hypothetical protein
VSRSDNVRRTPKKSARLATDTKFSTLDTALVEEPVAAVRLVHSETDFRKHTERPAGPDHNDMMLIGAKVSPTSTSEYQRQDDAFVPFERECK